MRLRTASLLALLTLSACAADDALEVDSTALPSNYPPDYPVCSISDGIETGPFALIQHQTNWGNGYGLTVAYRGYLRDSHADEDIWFHIDLNGQQVYVQAQPGSNGDAYARLWAGPHDCWYCAGYPGQDCPDGTGYVCTWPNEDEKTLFQWAAGLGRLNAWDMEVAASANGDWDSNLGSNYSARFEETSHCNF